MNIKVILGPNASGKTTLLDSINKEYAAKYGWSKIQYLTFRDSYGTSDSGYYLQQRWNDCDCSLVPSVREALGEFETSNPLVNQIYHNVFWGVRGNYRSMPTDCPQRDERLGWMGDRASESLL